MTFRPVVHKNPPPPGIYLDVVSDSSNALKTLRYVDFTDLINPLVLNNVTYSRSLFSICGHWIRKKDIANNIPELVLCWSAPRSGDLINISGFGNGNLSSHGVNNVFFTNVSAACMVEDTICAVTPVATGPIVSGRTSANLKLIYGTLSDVSSMGSPFSSPEVALPPLSSGEIYLSPWRSIFNNSSTEFSSVIDVFVATSQGSGTVRHVLLTVPVNSSAAPSPVLSKIITPGTPFVTEYGFELTASEIVTRSSTSYSSSLSIDPLSKILIGFGFDSADISATIIHQSSGSSLKSGSIATTVYNPPIFHPTLSSNIHTIDVLESSSFNITKQIVSAGSVLFSGLSSRQFDRSVNSNRVSAVPSDTQTIYSNQSIDVSHIESGSSSDAEVIFSDLSRGFYVLIITEISYSASASDTYGNTWVTIPTDPGGFSNFVGNYTETIVVKLRIIENGLSTDFSVINQTKTYPNIPFSGGYNQNPVLVNSVGNSGDNAAVYPRGIFAVSYPNSFQLSLVPADNAGHYIGSIKVFFPPLPSNLNPQLRIANTVQLPGNGFYFAVFSDISVNWQATDPGTIIFEHTLIPGNHTLNSLFGITGQNQRIKDLGRI